MDTIKDKVAVIAGVTGITGLSLARYLVQNNWKVYGISRNKREYLPEEVLHISLDLTDKEACKASLSNMTDVKYAFFCAFRAIYGDADTKANADMVANLIDCLPSSLVHFVLEQGTSYYCTSGGKTVKDELRMPYKETLPRLDTKKFYYEQEDVLFDRAKKLGFTWSMPRPSIIIGFAPYNAINSASCVAAYASICKHLDVPFKFPGTPNQYIHLQDASDADLVAKHFVWEVSTPEAANQAFNVVNGDLVRWHRLWPEIAEYFGVKPEEPTDEEPFDWDASFAGKEKVWEDIVTKHGLIKTNLEDILRVGIFKMLIGFSEVCLNDMTKSREMGFREYETTKKSYFKTFDELRARKYIPE